MFQVNPLLCSAEDSHTKIKPYFLQEIKVKKLKCRLLQFSFGALRVSKAILPQSMLAPFVPGRIAQSVGHLTRRSGVLGSIPGLATYFRFSFRFFKKSSCQLLAKVCKQQYNNNKSTFCNKQNMYMRICTTFADLKRYKKRDNKSRNN